VGKSRLISTIFQSITWRAITLPGATDSVKVLLCAPTGKSDFGIGALTLHSVFSLPVNQTSGPLRPLSNDTLKTTHCKLIDIQLIIIDEVSMVESKMLGYLDQRLCQVFRSQDVSFGGKSIIVFGDLKQLSPVRTSINIYQNPDQRDFENVKRMPRISSLSQEQRRLAALRRCRSQYAQNASQIRTRNAQHIALARTSNLEKADEFRSRNSAARSQRRKSE